MQQFPSKGDINTFPVENKKKTTTTTKKNKKTQQNIFAEFESPTSLNDRSLSYFKILSVFL